ncbi:MAG: carboxypeptidase regulatory-like domain-containing protein, partial [Candidatus Sericytochromatia bacterium]
NEITSEKEKKNLEVSNDSNNDKKDIVKNIEKKDLVVEKKEDVKPEIIAKKEIVNTEINIEKKTPEKTIEETKLVEQKAKKGSISGKVFLTNGSLPENIVINIKSIKNKYDSKVNIDKKGSFILSDLEQGQYTVSIQKEGFLNSQKQVLVKESTKTEVEIELLSSKGSISGKVTDQNLKPIKDLYISIDKNKHTISDKDGLFKLNDIEAGYKTLSVKKDNKEIESIEIDVMSGFDLNKEIIVNLNKQNNITDKDIPKKELINESNNIDEVKVSKKKFFSLISGKIAYKSTPIKGARVTIEGDKMTIMTISDESGNYSVKNVPIGSYKLTISKLGYQNKELNLEVKENIEIQQNFNLIKK